MKYHKFFLAIAFIAVYINAFSENVNKEWLKSYGNKTAVNDLKIKTDSEGYIYVAGTFDADTLNDKDWRLIKISPAGDTLFDIFYRGIYGDNDNVNAIEIDSDDNVYLTGIFRNGDESSVVINKVNKNGIVLWQNDTNYIEGTNEGLVIAIDEERNIYIGGNKGTLENADAFIHKYSSEGTLLWTYNINTEINEFICDIAINNNQQVIIATNISNGETNNILLTGLEATGDIIFERLFEVEDLGNKKCNALLIDGENNIYVAGYAETGNNKDYLTIKYKESGDVEWYALFDETSLDDEAIGIMVANELVIVTGNSTTAANANEHKDIVTIAYDLLGSQRWAQKFEGRDGGDDIAVKIIQNGENEIVIAAKVWFEENNFDTYLINYNVDGELTWATSYTDSLQGNNLISDATLDFLGNIYVALNTENASDVKGEVIKFNQPDKAIPALKDFLKMLTVGMIDASENAIVKNEVYEHCALAVDSFYFISYATLIDSCALHSFDLKQAMNAKISSYYSLPANDYVTYILKRFWVMGRKQTPLLAVTHYSHFNTTQLAADPKLTYSYDENGYPIPCLNCSGGTIDKAGAEAAVTWISLVQPRPWHYINGDPTVYLTSCTGAFTNLLSYEKCKVCTPTTYGQIQAGPSSATQHHEIEITLESNGIKSNDGCYNPILQLPSFAGTNHFYSNNTPIPTSFARLSALKISPHYAPQTVTSPVFYKSFYKVVAPNRYTHPIIDREYTFHTNGGIVGHSDPFNWMPGDVLTLCQVNELFNGFGEDICRYALAFGLYKIDRPGVNSKPVYFAFPGNQGLWFSGGPDMGIVYGNDLTSFCANGDKEIIENNFTEQCEFCNDAPQSLGLLFPVMDAANIRKYVATTDYTFFNNYWRQENITIGFRLNGGGLAKNLLSFDAVINPPPVTPPAGTPVVSLNLLSTVDAPLGEYQIEKEFTTITTGTTLQVHVRAQFKSGKAIDKIEPITLSNHAPNYNNMVSFFRGELKDYSSTVINYQIDVYQ